MPNAMTAAASAKKANNIKAAMRLRVQLAGVYTPDIATRIRVGQRLELVGKVRDESGEPVGETDHSKCLVPFKTLAGINGIDIRL